MKEEKVILTPDGHTVARMSVAQGRLEGLCEWFDLQGNKLCSGTFSNGKPQTGTFLNWSLHFGEFAGEDPWKPDLYCRDWVTIFEGSHDSALPDYSRFTEVWEDGKKKAH